MSLPINRTSFREIIPEVSAASGLLSLAADAHIRGEVNDAAQLLREADMPELREWLESIWGKRSPHVLYRPVEGSPASVARVDRVEQRMPNAAAKRQLIERDGHRCRLCGTPVIRAEVRQVLHLAYPQELPWGKRNADQHAAFQVFWLQYDHLLPHARGGDNAMENMLIACAACNFGRMNFTLAEVGFAPLQTTSPVDPSWDGLERVLPIGRRIKPLVPSVNTL